MYNSISGIYNALCRRDGQNGQTLVEYSLVLALIAIGCTVALTGFAVSMRDLYDTVKQAATAMAGS